ncbi:MAG: hypothetical protein Ct9H300mP21_10760 [Pseudomonadota bacterium]|nr:MAG: hypothetical protein Ct9H300mP21_10760 [Pseudomonadota bacterium]
MDQKLQVSSENDADGKLKFEFPENTYIPKGATYILAFTQQKFWFQDDAERKLKGAYCSCVDTGSRGKFRNKEKKKSKIKEGLKNFSITKFKKKNVLSQEKKENPESVFQKKKQKGRKSGRGRIGGNF